mmetsp:Transcript_5030/g.20094  ORF Transcript_5030/g.20094 Transcript_5030/m.20094 type:complete len:249 (-) Transcript_5030:445-1191(-)
MDASTKDLSSRSLARSVVISVPRRFQRPRACLRIFIHTFLSEEPHFTVHIFTLVLPARIGEALVDTPKVCIIRSNVGQRNHDLHFIQPATHRVKVGVDTKSKIDQQLVVRLCAVRVKELLTQAMSLLSPKLKGSFGTIVNPPRLLRSVMVQHVDEGHQGRRGLAVDTALEVSRIHNQTRPHKVTKSWCKLLEKGAPPSCPPVSLEESRPLLSHPVQRMRTAEESKMLRRPQHRHVTQVRKSRQHLQVS